MNGDYLYRYLYICANQMNADEVIRVKYKDESLIVKRAYRFAAELSMLPVIINAHTLIVYNQVSGSWSDSVDEEQLDREISNYLKIDPEKESLTQDIKIACELGILQRCAGGHTSVDPAILFKDGYQGRIEKVIDKIQTEKNQEKMSFYKAELIVLRAAQRRILCYINELENQYENIEDYELRNIIKRKIEACKNIENNGPLNFFEAIQLLAFIHEFNMIEGNGALSWGIRIDQVLNPYYLQDRENGLINEDTAIGLIQALWKEYQMYGERCANLTLGGINIDGKDMSNEMTLICMEASIREKSDVPLLTLRVHPEMNDIVWEKAINLVKSGQGVPAFYNDDIAIKTLMNCGITKEDAYNYSTLGCVELTIAGKEFTHTEGARINWLKILELMIFEGIDPITGKVWKLKEKHDLNEFQDFNEFYDWFKVELENTIDKVAEFIDRASFEYYKEWPTPYLSSITYGCIESGSDITHNGTKYYNLSINCVGMANTVDSLETIENIIFKEKKLTFDELKCALHANYVGYEALRDKMLSYSKYGNDIDSVDHKMRDLMKFFSEKVHSKKMINDRGTYRVGFYSVMHHALLGAKTIASPDGRLAGKSLANSLSPSQGMDVNGPTAVINSINKIPMDYMGNGGVLDMKFLPSFFDKKSHREAFRYLIETYFEEGGLELQLNVVDKETLILAQREPEKYKNLVVGVSGYSAYFVSLDKELQNEIILRTENAKI